MECTAHRSVAKFYFTARNCDQWAQQQIRKLLFLSHPWALPERWSRLWLLIGSTFRGVWASAITHVPSIRTAQYLFCLIRGFAKYRRLGPKSLVHCGFDRRVEFEQNFLLRRGLSRGTKRKLTRSSSTDFMHLFLLSTLRSL